MPTARGRRCNTAAVKINAMPRLQRLEWVYAPSPVYFVTACTVGRRALLANVKIHRAFRIFAQQAPSHGIWVGRYVLMPDHIHLFAGFSCQVIGLSAWVRSLKGFLSATLRQSGFPSPHWQKGFFDHVLRSDESYQKKWEYVSENPVRAGLVEHAGDWLYQGELHPLKVNRL